MFKLQSNSSQARLFVTCCGVRTEVNTSADVRFSMRFGDTKDFSGTLYEDARRLKAMHVASSEAIIRKMMLSITLCLAIQKADSRFPDERSNFNAKPKKLRSTLCSREVYVEAKLRATLNNKGLF